MRKRTNQDVRKSRFDKLTDLVESLPEVRVEPAGQRHFAFKVGKKTFGWYLNSHHDDGIVSMCCKSTPVRQRQLIAMDALHFYLPAYVGKQGWIGLRLDQSTVRWDAAVELLVAAYRTQAPKRLLVMLD